MVVTNVQAFSGDVEISSNLAVNTDDLFVDTVSGNVGIATGSPESKLNIYLDSETGTSNTVGLTITNASSDYTSVTNGFGSRILFKTNRGGASPTNTENSAEIKGYIYTGAGGTSDYHALDLDVYGDNGSLNKGISIQSMSATGGPADTIVHGNVGIGTDNPGAPLQVHGGGTDVLGAIAAFKNSAHSNRVEIRDEQTSPYIPPGVWGLSGGGLALGTQFTGIKFYASESGATETERMFIKGNGLVGIGTNPDKNLHVYGSIKCHNLTGTGSEEGLFLQSVGDWYNLSPGNDGYLHILGGASGQGFMIGNYASLKLAYLTAYGLTHLVNNNGLGTTSPLARMHMKQGHDQSYLSTSLGHWDNGAIFERAGNTNRWVFAHDDVGSMCFFYNTTRKGYLLAAGSDSRVNFTGQHRTFIKDIPFTEAEALEGLIVSADQNKYIKMSGGIAAGSNAITTNESLPVVSISTVSNDKKCFGVISASEDPEKRQEMHGNFVSEQDKEIGDTRVYINSVGEGAMWVTNINGPLESGDYITTSNIAGYGMKQDSDSLKNYTVAKITMDCDFAPVDQPIQQIIKELSNVNYYINTSNIAIPENDYNRLDEEEKENHTLEVREEMVNVLDEHGQIQWEDHPTETEKAYKIRYLTADGQITDEANAVYKAAFVGCTYHCG